MYIYIYIYIYIYMYIYSVDIEGCLAVTYLERPHSTFSQFSQLFLICKFYEFGQ